MRRQNEGVVSREPGFLFHKWGFAFAWIVCVAHGAEAINAPVMDPEPLWTEGAANTISWSAVTSATAYYLEWSANASFTPPAGNSNWIGTTSFNATALTDGQTYYYHVKARDVLLTESAWSNATSSTQDATPPSSPGTPTDEGLSTTSTTVLLNWTAASDSGSGVASYLLQVGIAPGHNEVSDAWVGSVLTWTVSASWLPGHTLFARVRAHDQVGNFGPWSGNSDGILVELPSGCRSVTRAQQYYGLGDLRGGVFSPDGNYFLTGGTAGAFLWDVQTGEVVRMFAGCTPIAFSPDGTKVLTGSADRTPKLWDAFNGSLLRTFPDHTNGASSVAFSPDGTQILIGGAEAKLWDATNASELRTFSGHDATLTSVAFSPEGTKVLTGSWDGLVKLWDTSDGSLLRTIPAHMDGVWHATFSPDGTSILTGGLEDDAKLWDVSNGLLLRTFSGNYTGPTPVSFSPDGTKVLTCNEYCAMLWDASDGALLRTIEDGGHFFSFSSDGAKILMGSRDYLTARLLDAFDGSLLRTISRHTTAVDSVAISPDGTKVLTNGTILSGSDFVDIARLSDTFNGLLLRSFSEQEDSVRCVAFSPDGRTVLAGGSRGAFNEVGTANLWDASNGSLLRTFSGHTGSIMSVAFSPDGTKVATGASGEWTGSYYAGEAKLWDVSNGSLLRTFSGHTGSITSVAFSPDGTGVLTGSVDRTAKLWDAATSAEIRAFSGHEGLVRAVAFSPDGSKILTGSADKTAKLWDATNGSVLRTFSGHASAVDAVAFSPDGAEVLTGSDDTTARLWDASNGLLLSAFSGHAGGISSVAFSPDGTKVLTGSRDGTARLWEICPAKAIIVAGGGPYPGNEIAAQTQELAAYAYKICRRRGYAPTEIQYLSAFGAQDADGDGNNDVDAYATPGALYDALDTFSSDTSRLFIYMVDHGFHICNDMWFQINPTQKVGADVLDFCLDELQTSRTCHVTLVVDSCYSGHFLWACRPPVGKRRITIASTTKDNIAIFLPPPSLTSFSYQFLGALYMGYRVQEAFVSSRQFFRSIGGTNQAPWIDAEGDGVYTEGVDDASTGPAAEEFFGTSWAYTAGGGWEPPAFAEVTPSLTPDLGSTVTIWANMLPNQAPQRVWATILPPESLPLAGQPLTNLPRVELLNTTGTSWSAPFGGLDTVGDYVVAHVAQFEYERITQPVYSILSVGAPPSPPPIKAVLVSGEDGSSTLSQQAITLANLAYRVSRHRGYERDEIRYLSAYGPQDADGDLLNDVSSTSTLLNFVDVLSDWATTDCERLLVYLVGPSEEIGGEVRFWLNGGETLDAATLDGQLDALQMVWGVEDVIVVAEFPNAADFLRGCQPPPGKQRVLIAATDSAFDVLLNPPLFTSFSFEFLSSVHMGRNLYDSYVATSLFFMGIPNLHQMPWLDSTGDGVSNWEDREHAESLYWGYPWAFAGPDGGELHAVLDAGPHVTGVTDEVVFWADVTEGPEPVQVIATIIPPSIEYTPGQATTEFPWLELLREGGSWRWSKTISGFDERGEYTVLFHAVYDCDRLSSPMQVQLQVAGDAYEVDDTAAEASEYLFSLSPDTPTTQVHNFHDPGDMDWVRFYGSGGEPYTLHVEDPGTSCNAVIELYDLTSGSILLGRADFNGPGQGESLSILNLPTTGTFHWVVYSSDPSFFGAGTSYTLRISYDGGPGLPIATALPVSARRMDVSWLSSYGSGDGYLVFHRPVVGEAMRPEAADRWTTRTPSPLQTQTFLDIGLQPVTTYEYVVRISGTNDPAPPACTPVFSGTTYEESSFASFSTPEQSVEEDAGTVTIPFRLMDPSLETVTVHYSMGGTATAGDDYSTDSSGVIFAPGETTASAILTLVQDGMVEPDETIVVTITFVENAGWGSTRVHTITIIGNDTDAQRWSLYP